MSVKPKFIVVCNFDEFLIYDEENPSAEPVSIMLADLSNEYYRLKFLINVQSSIAPHEDPISKQAGELVGMLKKALTAQYKDPDSDRAKRSICILCVRLVFCLYAEDSGVFNGHLLFHDYLEKYAKVSPAAVRTQLIELFKVLDTPKEDREYIDDDLDIFPYVNGGLFSDENIEIPRFTDEIVDILLNKASAGFDWSNINPTIFGAMFESVLSSDERSDGGMHYTEPKNIHKVIDPLFLNDLKADFERINSYKESAHGAKVRELEKFRKRLSELVFLDPACGSGNFLTETFISLRRLENSAIAEIRRVTENEQMALADTVDYTDIKVRISQFYGIEIHDFAVSVAKTALWIAEHQMLKETEEILHQSLDFLPLKTYANIIHGNALRINWEDVVPKERLSFIMGNPPFLYGDLTAQQKEERNIIFDGKGGELDYVACWYKIAADYMKGTSIECALVSTNSITQGQQVYPLWHDLFESGIVINFAHRTFRWDSEASNMAHVHCVIIGFSYVSRNEKLLFEGDTVQKVGNINAYLLNAPNVIIEKRRTPISTIEPVVYGIKPADNGYLILTDEERARIIKDEPESEKWIRPFITAKEYLHGINRYCLWLVGIAPDELDKLKNIYNRVAKCREWRSEQVKTGDAFKLKDTPTLMRPSKKFKEEAFIVLPRHSSENRQYIPFGYVESGCIPGDSVSILPNATLFHFSVLISSVHMAWTKTVCGRLESRFRYASDIVYNTFPWCMPTDKQKAKIEETAQAILDTRAKYPNSSLAQMYEPTKMPPDLRKAHKANDKAVMQAYGFKADMPESEIVAELMKMYKAMTE